MSNKEQEQLDLYFSPHGETLKASASTLKDNPAGTSDYINEKQKSLHSPRGYYDPDVFLSPQKFVQKTCLTVLVMIVQITFLKRFLLKLRRLRVIDASHLQTYRIWHFFHSLFWC